MSASLLIRGMRGDNIHEKPIRFDCFVSVRQNRGFSANSGTARLSVWCLCHVDSFQCHVGSGPSIRGSRVSCWRCNVENCLLLVNEPYLCVYTFWMYTGLVRGWFRVESGFEENCSKIIERQITRSKYICQALHSQDDYKAYFFIE